MEAISSSKLAELTGGICSSKFSTDIEVRQVSIDSRNVGKNCLFVSIRGDKHDGHSFVADIVKEPSNFAIVDDKFTADLPNLIRVADTTKALGLLSRNYRQSFKIPLVAITGSNGKTTVKEMLRSVCNAHFGADKVLATSGNLNNHLGVPLTLLELESKHSVAIIEMGMNHAGELDYLSKLTAPTMAVVNNVMFAHAGFFNSIDDIANAKGEIYNGLTSESIACVDLNIPYNKDWLKHLPTKNIFLYGNASDSQCYIKEQQQSYAIYHTSLGEIKVNLQILGEHNYLNALTVVALAINLGCSLNSIKSGLEAYGGYKGRLERKTAFNGAMVIDDSYNANPDSVKAALKAIQVLPKPHWFVFGDLKELGEKELDFHKEIGEAANYYKIDKLLTIGNLAMYAAQFFNGQKIHFESNMDIVEYCISHLPSTATLLIKGSNSLNLHEVVNGLVEPKMG